MHRILMLLFPILTVLYPAAAQAAGSRDFAGLIDIGSGRKMYLECRGRGSPMVVLISGKGNGAAEWSEILDPADPVRKSPYDMAGHEEGAAIYRSASAVLPLVSGFTRVCAYDRPGTRIAGKNISTSVPQPHPVDEAVDDLHKLLAASGEPGPYVLVAHSYGGLIARLFSRRYPKEVVGLVMIDVVSELVQKTASPAALARWDKLNRMSSPEAPEAVELLDAFAKINAAPPLPRLPTIVLSADKPWDPVLIEAHNNKVGGATVTWDESLAAQNLLAASGPGKHVKNTNSGHYVYWYAPRLVADAIHEVVATVRSGSQKSAGWETPSWKLHRRLSPGDVYGASPKKI
jgi:pimeloyl-ACP methyl ester carboxylesterase